MAAMEPLKNLLERTVAGLGYELSDLEISNRGKMLRVFIDKEHEIEGAGITLDDCTRVTRQLQRVLPVEGVCRLGHAVDVYRVRHEHGQRGGDQLVDHQHRRHHADRHHWRARRVWHDRTLGHADYRCEHHALRDRRGWLG